MASLGSDKVRRALTSKLGCEEETGKDHIWFLLRDEKGTLLSKTKISNGPKHTIGDTIISMMTRQIMLGTTSNFVGMVNCSKTKEDCIAFIKQMCR